MRRLLLIIVVFGFVVSSCDIASFDDDVNKNPNLPSEAEPSELSTVRQDIVWTETAEVNTVRTFGMNLIFTFYGVNYEKVTFNYSCFWICCQQLRHRKF